MLWTGEAKPGFPYWWEDAVWPDLPSTPPDTADVLIIGAGYTGLSAAIAAHDTGARVVVVDAGVPGQGASTRNGGMTGAHPRLGWEALRAQFGAEVADGLFAEATPALGFAKRMIKDEAMECEFQETGRIQLSWTASHFETQKRLAADVTAKSEVGVHVLERAELDSEIVSEKYFGGLVFPEHGAVHPRKYHGGWLKAALRRDIPVIANCRVEDCQRDGAGFVVQTKGGTIRADKVILATNGYTPAIFRWHQRRVFPLPSFLIATEQLPPEVIDAVAPGRRMMVETRARHSYYRVSPDGTRILFGGRSSMKPINLGVAAQRLRATMCEVWPSLADVAISHVWTGNTGYSFSHMPSVGEQDGLHYAMGFSGSGTVMAPYLGAKAAWAAVGDPRAETAYRMNALKPHWMHPFKRPHFLSLADLWYRFAVDPMETRKGRKAP